MLVLQKAENLLVDLVTNKKLGEKWIPLYQEIVLLKKVVRMFQSKNYDTIIETIREFDQNKISELLKPIKIEILQIMLIIASVVKILNDKSKLLSDMDAFTQSGLRYWASRFPDFQSK